MQEQAFQAVQLSNSIVLAARNAMQDANDMALINSLLPLKTFDQFKKEFGREGGGSAMYTKIIAEAKKQISELGCFVAGTLVHTQEGLRPIEQIKVGDYVLSKPESGHGDASYKRVSQTFKYDDKEIWYVRYEVLDSIDNYNKLNKEKGFFVATGNHPIWVKGLIDSYGKYHELNLWETVCDLCKYLDVGSRVLFMLHDGRSASVIDHGGLLSRSDMPDMGIVNTGYIHEGCDGQGIDFSSGKPELSDWLELNLDDQIYPDSDAPDGSVGSLGFGFPPLLRTVYNLEVEENHTYYVGEHGVLVHNTSASVLSANKGVAQNPSEAFAENLGSVALAE